MVFAEEPTYFLAKSIFEDFKLKVVQIAMEDDGLNLDALEHELQSREAQQQHLPKVVYTIPTAHNPTGRTMPNWKRKKLVAMAEKYGFVIIADEAYQLLTFPSASSMSRSNGTATTTSADANALDEEMPTPMALVDPKSEHVFAVGSFSKIFAPGVRLGWIHARYSQLDRLYTCGQIFSGGGVSPVVCGAMHAAIASGELKSLLEWTRDDLHHRATRMLGVLREKMPSGCRIEVPQGGYFILYHLPIGKDAAALEDICRANYELDILPGSSFSATMAHCFRLSFSFYQVEDYDRACTMLSSAIEDFLST